MKRITATGFLFFVLLATPLIALSQVCVSGDIAFGWNFVEDSKAKAMGVSIDMNLRPGYDFNRYITAFGELGLNAVSPSINKTSFINVPRRYGLLTGLGCAFSFGHGLSVGLSAGLFFNIIEKTYEMKETGLYASLAPKFLLLSLLPKDDCYNLAITLPFYIFWTGNGYQARFSMGIGIDCSSFGKRK